MICVVTLPFLILNDHKLGVCHKEEDVGLNDLFIGYLCLFFALNKTRWLSGHIVYRRTGLNPGCVHAEKLPNFLPNSSLVRMRSSSRMANDNLDLLDNF